MIIARAAVKSFMAGRQNLHASYPGKPDFILGFGSWSVNLSVLFYD
jgi:hypothetical protein